MGSFAMKQYRDKRGRFAKQYRDKRGRFAKHVFLRDVRGRFISKKQALAELELKEARDRYRVIQSGPIALDRRGYFLVITALVPGQWAGISNSSPVFEEDEGSEPYQQVIWRTTVQRTVGKALEEYRYLLADEKTYAFVNDYTYLVLSSELMVLYEDLSSYSIKIWTGTDVPRWIERLAKKA